MAETSPIDVFFSYAPEDEHLKGKLEDHLALLRRQGLVRGWSARSIGAGEDWRGEVDRHLERADLILLLVSADLLASDYLFDREMRRAVARHESGDAEVIPVILRACDWREAPFAEVRPRPRTLPENGVPVTAWSDLDAALTDVTCGIREAVRRRLSANPPPAHHPSPSW